MGGKQCGVARVRVWMMGETPLRHQGFHSRLQVTLPVTTLCMFLLRRRVCREAIVIFSFCLFW
jgi:hypothetical protein